MAKPGLQRAIPAGLIGFAFGGLLVLILRTLQNMDPVWDAEVALVVIPFTVLAFFIWGMGAFNPSLNEHAHAPGEHDHDAAHASDSAIVATEAGEKALAAHDDHSAAAETEEPPVGILTSQLWLVATLSILLFLGIFAFATLPGSPFLQQTDEAEASVAAFETEQTFLLPLGVGEFQASQLTVFLGFVAFTLVSIFVAAVVLWTLVNGLHHNVKQVKEQDYSNLNEQAASKGNRVSRAIAAVVVRTTRTVGRFFKRLARGLRNGIPAFLGQR
jgi:Na+-transporting methylmalonyl-CoA/oxaloacetate decarboxylase gamma subunit